LFQEQSHVSIDCRNNNSIFSFLAQAQLKLGNVVWKECNHRLFAWASSENWTLLLGQVMQI
jgi:hypothetical protein